MTAFRSRDWLLGAYYLAFLTMHWYALRRSNEDARGFAGGLLMLGVISVLIAGINQRDRPEGLKFGRLGLRAFLFLMAALITVDLLTIGWPEQAPWIPRGQY